MKTHIKIILIVAMIFILLLGIGLMLYPLISSQYAQSHHSEAYGDYKEEVAQADTSLVDNEWLAAKAYNESLYNGEINHLDPLNNGYYEQLDLSRNGIMGYISIPKIDVTLPIFHGASDETLKVGAGHMPESSLPVGGMNTHCVITAHSGMASEPMFTNLEMLEIGDTFQLFVLNEVLTYEVYSVPAPVLPQQVDAIQIQDGEDLCTLITCTPFGVNTHRLLVHAKRIETVEVKNADPEEPTEQEDVTTVWEEHYRESLLTGIMIAMIALFALAVIVILYVTLPKRGNAHDK